jgi:Glycosyltransferase family 87
MATLTSVPSLRVRRPHSRFAIAGYAVLLAEVVVVTGFAAWYDAFDFHIYSLGGHAVLHGMKLYQFHWRRHGFTYPPFAAVAILPLTVIPTALSRVLWDVGSVVALAHTCRVLLQMAGLQVDRARLAQIVAASLLLQPVWNTLFLGQINLLLLLLVVADVQRAARDRTTGLGIGLAAAVKLTPLIFIAVLVLAGRVRSGLLAAATFCGASLTGYLVAPQASRLYWSRYLLDTSRIGDATYISNQSPYGSLSRLLGGTAAIGPWYFLVPALLGTTGLAVAVTFARREDWLDALTVAGMTGLLASPISWSHHWVWALPVIALAARSGPRGRRWAIATFGFGVLAPQWWVPARLQSGLHGPVTVLANSFTLAGLAFLAWMSCRALRIRRTSWQGTLVECWISAE